MANPLRLRILHRLFKQPDQSVSDIAAAFGLSLPVACQCLRALNARGLLGVRREGRRVFYRPAADPAVEGSAVLLRAMATVLADESDAGRAVCRLLTGFTHPHRIAIVQALEARAVRRTALGRRTGISRSALNRHLRKLRERGYVVESNNGRLALTRPRNPLAAALLGLACRQ